MILKDYQKIINILVKNGHGNKEVFYSIDDEGNQYKPVYYSPTVMPASDAPKDANGLSKEFVCVN